MVWSRRITVRRVISIKTTVPVEEPEPVTEQVVVGPKHECCICLEENVPEQEKTECGHCVCSGCLDQMTKPVCPMCRSEIALSDKAQERIDTEKNRKLKLRVYARLFRAIDTNFYDWLDYFYTPTDPE
jgi:hypothetical protein